MQQDSLSLGLELVKTAVAEDGAGRYVSAVRHYDLAVASLSRALSDPAQQHHAALIAQKIREYSERRAVLVASGVVAASDPPPALAFQTSPNAVSSSAPSSSSSLAPPAATSINDILRLAFDVAQHARQEDACGNARGAFELYTQCLESFLIVYKEEQNPMLKEQLRHTILEYTERAEALKLALQPLQAHPGLVVQKREAIRNEESEGPYNQTVRKQHPGYSGSCEMQVTINKRKFRVDENVRVHVVVNNYCGRQVETLKAYLLCTTDSYYWKSPDAQERKSETVKVLPREFNCGKAFPLPSGHKFEGDFEYLLGPHLKPTERKDPTVLTREYVIVVKCFFSRPWRDLKAFAAISVFIN